MSVRPGRDAEASPLMRRALVMATMLLCLAWFFRDALATGMNVLYGDS